MFRFSDSGQMSVKIRRAENRHTFDGVMEILEPPIASWFRAHFDDLTEPQAYAIPLIHHRESVLVSSPTGSGKTLTAFLAIINEMYLKGKRGELEDRIYAVYVSPLKALANDVEKNLKRPLAEMMEENPEMKEIRVAVRSGDTSQYERQKMVKKPPHILITTPESLALVLSTPKFRKRFDSVEYLILDEIHEISESKRGSLLSLTMEILQNMSPGITRIGLSATQAPIEEIARYLGGFEIEDGEPVERAVNIVEVKARKDLDIKVISPVEDMTVLPYDVVNARMYDLLVELIQEHRSTIVFTNTRSSTETVAYKLKERGVEAIAAHHGSLSKETRLDVEEKLRAGELRCVVTSTSLELGIDIGYVDLVVQIGSPKSVAKGLQRIGRAGHSVGKTAKGRFLVFDLDDMVECAVLAREAVEGHIDRVSIPKNPLDVLSQGIVSLSLIDRWDIREAYDLIRRSYTFHTLTWEDYISVLEYLGGRSHEGIYSKIWYDPEEGIFGRKKGSRTIYYLNLGTIPDEANYRVVVVGGGPAGELSEKFVEKLYAGDVFVLGGRSYEFIKTKGTTVLVKSAGGKKPTVPSWTGEMLPRSFDLSLAVAEFRDFMKENIDMYRNTDTPDGRKGAEKMLDYLVNTYHLDSGVARSLMSYFREQFLVAGIPGKEQLLVEGYRDMQGLWSVIFHFPFGRRVNDALSRAYAAALSKEVKQGLSVSINDDAFMITSPSRIDIEGVERLISPDEIEEILHEAIRGTELFRQRFRHCAGRSFLVLRSYLGHSISVGRQQRRASQILDALADIDAGERFPVIKETYHEILRMAMDVEGAKYVLSRLRSGEWKCEHRDYTDSPSPFSYSIILSGISDIVLMEDRTALLKELHTKILRRITTPGGPMLEPDRLKAHFERKIWPPKEINPDHLLRIMDNLPINPEIEAGLPQTMRPHFERIKEIARMLENEGKIASVFLSQRLFASEKLASILMVLPPETEPGDRELKIAALLDGAARSEATDIIAEHEGVDRKEASAVLNRLERLRIIHLYKGSWKAVDRSEIAHLEDRAVERGIRALLSYYGPMGEQELAHRLGTPQHHVSSALEEMRNSGAVISGSFYHDNEFILSEDYHTIIRGETVYSGVAVRALKLWKLTRAFDGIGDYLDTFGHVRDPLDVYNRVPGFSMDEWDELRRRGELLQGRFVVGKVCFVPREMAPLYIAAYRTHHPHNLDAVEKKVLSALKKGPMTLSDLSMATGIPDDRLKPALRRLDDNMYIVREFRERELWGRRNLYSLLGIDGADLPEREEAIADIVRTYLKSSGPAGLSEIRHQTDFTGMEVQRALKRIGAEAVLTGSGDTEFYLMPEDLHLLETPVSYEENIMTPLTIVSLFDPLVATFGRELYARYGQGWMHPLVCGGVLAGIIEDWPSNDGIEIREMDLHGPSVEEFVQAIKKFMAYYSFFGVEIARIRKIAEGMDARELKTHGFKEIKGSLVYGDILPISVSWEQALNYILWRAGFSKDRVYRDTIELLKSQIILRSDPEIALRVRRVYPLEYLHKEGRVLKGYGIPPYLSYIDAERAGIISLFRKKELTHEEEEIFDLIRRYGPIPVKDILASPLMGRESARKALRSIFRSGLVFKNSWGHYLVPEPPDIDRDEAVRLLISAWLDVFGLVTPSHLSSFSGFAVSLWELKKVLREMETEGKIVKGLFLEDDDRVFWIPSGDTKKLSKVKVKEPIVIYQDSLTRLYLADFMKRHMDVGAESLVLDGGKIIGTFSGYRRNGELFISSYKGSSRLPRVVKHAARRSGLTVSEESEDEASEEEYRDYYERAYGR